MKKEVVDHLIGRNVEINLCVSDVERYRHRGEQIPLLPKIRGKLIKRIKTWTWCYIMELTEPVFLDQEGINEKVRNKYSTRFVKVLPNVTESEKAGRSC